MFFSFNWLKIVGAMVCFFLICSTSLSGYSATPGVAVVINGRPLKHLGTGLREYLFFDIYTLDAYSESGACALSSIVYSSETKMLRLTMRRDIPVNHLRWQVQKTFEQNMPQSGNTASLKEKISAFLALFKKDLAEGTAVEIAYVPGKGSTVTQNGRLLGPPIPGRDFPELAWRSFFGGNTCCEKGKKMIVEQCLQAAN